MAVYDDDRLHAELDRQLAEVRAASDAVATRSGLLKKIFNGEGYGLVTAGVPCGMPVS